MDFLFIAINDDIASRFAEIRVYLRRRGQIFGDLDIFVAATALTCDLTLLSYNRRHFECVPDLKHYQLTSGS